MPKVNAKKKCCKDKPRCKACPVTLKRLADAGFATRSPSSARKFIFEAKPSKAALAAARAR